MRADERQAAVAYAYAWWMTGDDDDASTALREAISAPDPAEDSDEARLVALMSGIRAHLGDTRPMPPPAEVALLHDGFDVPLEPAAKLALVPPGGAATALAHGRLEALLETVREDFRHPERLGGLATGNPADLEHTEECRSCARAAALIQRGRNELREVSAVSAPPGLIGSLVAEFSPPEAEPDQRAASDEAGTAGAGGLVVLDEPTAADGVVTDVDAPVDTEAGAPAEDAASVEAEPVADPAADLPPVDLPPTDVEPEAAPGEDVAADRIQTTPGRRRAAGVLAGAGILALGALVVFFIASSGDDPQPAVDTGAVQSPEPRNDGETEPAGDDGETEPAFGPDEGEREGFSVVNAGLLLSGGKEMAPSGTRIDPQEPLRIAVDYTNGSRGVQLNALWRVDEEVYERLHAVVSAKTSRHVWGVPVPPEAWPEGKHRIVITADDRVAGAIDFTVRK